MAALARFQGPGLGPLVATLHPAALAASPKNIRYIGDPAPPPRHIGDHALLPAPPTDLPGLRNSSSQTDFGPLPQLELVTRSLSESPLSRSDQSTSRSDQSTSRSDLSTSRSDQSTSRSGPSTSRDSCEAVTPARDGVETEVCRMDRNPHVVIVDYGREEII